MRPSAMGIRFPFSDDASPADRHPSGGANVAESSESHVAADAPARPSSVTAYRQLLLPPKFCHFKPSVL